MRTLIFLTLGAVMAFEPQETRGLAERDTAVYRAVLANPVRFTLVHMDHQSGPVIVLNQTISMCSSAESNQTRFGCLREADLDESFEASGSSFGDRLSKDRRLKLSAAFRTRNARSVTFSGLNLEGLLVVAPDVLASVPADRAQKFSAFSQPAFSDDGYALVYAATARVGPGGAGWFCLLQQRGESWNVVRAVRVWMG